MTHCATALFLRGCVFQYSERKYLTVVESTMSWFHPPLSLLLLVVLVSAAMLVPGATGASPCPEVCHCTKTRTRAAADCSSSSLAHVPIGLSSLTSILDLSYNRLTVLRNNTFRPMAFSLRKLVLSNNNIAEIETGTFDQFQQLSWLNLENNALHILDPRTFSGATSLWKLVLNGNPLQLQTDGSPFLIAPGLRNLELSRCGIDTLPPATFQNLTGLWTLRLQENRLQGVEAIQDLPELELLDLHGNEIASLHPDVFATVPRLKQLNVSSNPLLLPSAGPLLNAPRLSFLDLSHTNVIRLNRNIFSGTPSLTILRISNTSLRWIDSRAFSNLSLLERAVLDGNAIETLEPNTFSSNDQLLELDLSDNGLAVSADSQVLESATLTTLDLRGSRIPAIGEETLRGLPALSVLDAGSCGITELQPGAFAHLPDLYELRLPHNQLTSLPEDVFSQCHRLAEVNLRGNRLRRLTSFPAAPALERLDLGECGLGGDLPVMSRVPRLRRLLVDGNRLNALDADNLTGALPSLRRLAVQKNPWRCDCALRPLWRWCHDLGPRRPVMTSFGRPADAGEDSNRCPEDVMCGEEQREHWDLLETLRCEGDAESIEANSGHDPNLDVEVIDLPRQRTAPIY